jgi:hypothetical protein
MAHSDVHRQKAKHKGDHAVLGDEGDGGACKQDWRVRRWDTSDGRFRADGREPVLEHCMPVVPVTVLWPDRRNPSCEAGF